MAFACSFDMHPDFISLYSGTFSILQDSLPKYILLLTNAKTDKQKTVAEGARTKIWADTNIFKGVITSITRDSLLVGGSWLPVTAVDRLRVHTTGTNIAGIVFITLGAVTTPLGIVLLINGIRLLAQTGSEWAVFFQTLFGILEVGAGIVVVPLGIISVAGGIIIIQQGKNFNLHNQWRLSIVRSGYQ